MRLLGLSRVPPKSDTSNPLGHGPERKRFSTIRCRWHQYESSGCVQRANPRPFESRRPQHPHDHRSGSGYGSPFRIREYRRRIAELQRREVQTSGNPAVARARYPSPRLPAGRAAGPAAAIRCLVFSPARQILVHYRSSFKLGGWVVPPLASGGAHSGGGALHPLRARVGENLIARPSRS